MNLTNDDPRIAQIVETLLAFARHDFTTRPAVEGTDFVATIAAGLNMLAEELDGAVASRHALEKAYEDLKLTEARLVHAGKLAAIGQLASGVAHEINNPATWVAISLSLIERNVRSLMNLLETNPQDLKASFDALRTIMQSVADATDGMDRIRLVVGDLRTFSRSDDDSMEPIALNDVAQSACNLAMPSLRGRARLVLDLGTVPLVLGNRGRLGQVVTNLLVNASQALVDGDPDRDEVRLMTFTEEDRVVLAIEDTGPGIPPDLRDRVFEPFFTTKPAGIGTGLGLSLVAQIVRRHGGDVRVSSTPQGGARLELWLPAFAPIPGLVTSEVLPTPDTTDAGGRVLVIDDEPGIRRALSACLEPPHRAVLASSGHEALRLLAKDTDFDMILCDLHMPDGDGVDVHTALQEQAPGLLPRLVYMTGGAISQRARTFLRDIRPALLDKPIDPSVLDAKLLDLAAARRARVKVDAP